MKYICPKANKCRYICSHGEEHDLLVVDCNQTDESKECPKKCIPVKRKRGENDKP